jgi:hypothetical protein
VVGLDIFEDQHLNTDQSGYGSRAAVEAHLAEHVHGRGAAVTLVKADSTTVAPDDLIRRFGHFRAVSVDGSHTAEATEADLHLAEAICGEGGIVFLDDILNPHWLGVIEGYSRYAGRTPGLVPFCIGENKLFLAKGALWAARYRDHIAVNRPQCITKAAVPFFGHEIPVLGGGPHPFFSSLPDRLAGLADSELTTEASCAARAELAAAALSTPTRHWINRLLGGR